MTKNNSYSVSVEKDSFSFNAAHFLIYEKGYREPIHGHNFHVKVILRKNELEDSMVIDFTKLERIINKILDPLKDKLILPENNDQLVIRIKDNQIEISHKDEILSIPKRDCIVLPIKNSSTEYLAEYIACEIMKQMQLTISYMEVFVEEAKGCVASYQIKGC